MIMNNIIMKKKTLLFAAMSYALITGVCLPCFVHGDDNQTDMVSPVLPSTELPFQVHIVQDSFTLPSGLQSYVYATYEGKWLLLAGRTNGLHNFEDDNNNFPPNKQNTVVYVVNPKTQRIFQKSLDDPSSGLSQEQIDTLSVTSPQFYQWKKKLYISGGYGVDTATGQFGTKDTLTSIDIPGLMHWVSHPNPETIASEYIQQISDPIFQVTGGYMTRVDDNLSLLIFGQNFIGYYLPTSNGNYTQQVRRFKIDVDSPDLQVTTFSPTDPDPSFRRRDLNVVPIIQTVDQEEQSSYVALSGVFTLEGGAWTVPVNIYPDGSTFMPDPCLSTTFKQAMNNYACPNLGLFSKHRSSMYTTIFGGISYGYFKDGQCTTDSELPFINQVTTIEIDQDGQFTQYIMEGQYPVILYKQTIPLLFGAGAQFIPTDHLPAYSNGVLKFDKLHDNGEIIGYIVGGIQSIVGNTQSYSETSASPHIFKVYLIKN
jgi:hypothetical protein